MDFKPALKLLSFFRNMANREEQRQEVTDDTSEVNDGNFETKALQRSSGTMAELAPLGKDHVRMWVKYWKSRKYM